jgi:hypothetical protein
MVSKSSIPLLIFASLSLGTACQKSSSDKNNADSGSGTPGGLPLQDPANASGTATGTATNPDGSPIAPAPGVDPNNPSTGTEPLEPGGPAQPTTPVDPDPIPPPPLIPPTELAIKENQFWVYTKVDNKLSFNTPWDATEGDAIERDGQKLPSFAQRCLQAAEKKYQTLAAKDSFKEKMLPLLALGATPQLTFLTIVVDNNGERDNLRKLDRDAYFWHWTDPAKKPVLTMNIYQKGTWVWEVVASPASCLQPSEKELLRYLDYAAKRFAEKGLKL